VCKLGFVPKPGNHSQGDPANDVYPKTGTCVPMNQDCDFPDACYTDEDYYTICPYCEAYKTHGDHGFLHMGNYDGGSGSLYEGPMYFTDGDHTNCGDGLARETHGYWYCWYDGYTDHVPLDHIHVLWLEDPADKCFYQAYIYTPLACDFAEPFA